MVRWLLVVTFLVTFMNVRVNTELIVKPDGMFYQMMRSDETWNFSEENNLEDSETRIVGGDVYQQNEYPFMAAVARASSGKWVPYCGGSIISNLHVLTAAHCTDPAKATATQLAVLLGYYDMSHTSSSAIQNKVKTIIQHKNYDSTTMANDISILILSTSVTFNVAIAPIALATDETDVTGQTLKVIGWGADNFGGPMNNLPKEMNTPVVSTAKCSTAWGGIVPAVKPTQICTLSPNESPCQGDSGGPVVWFDPKTQKYVLVGIVSFGPNCMETKPSVQTKVASYLQWIYSGDAIKRTMKTVQKSTS